MEWSLKKNWVAEPTKMRFFFNTITKRMQSCSTLRLWFPKLKHYSVEGSLLLQGPVSLAMLNPPKTYRAWYLGPLFGHLIPLGSITVFCHRRARCLARIGACPAVSRSLLIWEYTRFGPRIPLPGCVAQT